MGSKIGVLKIAASRIGIPFQDYLLFRDFGYKWCTSCKSWKPIDTFNIDRSRGDNRKASCKRCNMSDDRDGPGKAMRRKMREKGYEWCRKCEDWLPSDQVHSGLCQEHSNQYNRERYNSDPEFRNKVRSRVYQRQKSVEDVPLEGQEYLMKRFDSECAYCTNDATTWDHIIPISKGGTTIPGNIVPCCKSCNSSKKDRDFWEWAKKNDVRFKHKVIDRMMLRYIHPPA